MVMHGPHPPDGDVANRKQGLREQSVFTHPSIYTCPVVSRSLPPLHAPPLPVQRAAPLTLLPYSTPSSLRYHKRTEAHTGLACAHLGTGADNGKFFSPKIHSPLWTRMHVVAASSRHATSSAALDASPHASHHLSPEEGISVSWKFPGKREVLLCKQNGCLQERSHSQVLSTSRA